MGPGDRWMGHIFSVPGDDRGVLCVYCIFDNRVCMRVLIPMFVLCVCVLPSIQLYPPVGVCLTRVE